MNTDKPSCLFSFLSLIMIPMILAFDALVARYVWIVLLADKFGSLSYLNAMGLVLFVGILTAHFPAKDNETAAERFPRYLYWSTSLWGVAAITTFIISLFIG
jgi:hypothetical protein